MRIWCFWWPSQGDSRWKAIGSRADLTESVEQILPHKVSSESVERLIKLSEWNKKKRTKKLDQLCLLSRAENDLEIVCCGFGAKKRNALFVRSAKPCSLAANVKIAPFYDKTLPWNVRTDSRDGRSWTNMRSKCLGPNSQRSSGQGTGNLFGVCQFRIADCTNKTRKNFRQSPGTIGWLNRQ